MIYRVVRTQLDDLTTSELDLYEPNNTIPAEKMSKSRGNCVTVDMAVNGVQDIPFGYEFRDQYNRTIVNWKRCGIWQDKRGSGMFYAGVGFSNQPVLLSFTHEIIPARLLIRGHEIMQHLHLTALWDALERAFPCEFETRISYYVRSLQPQSPPA